MYKCHNTDEFYFFSFDYYITDPRGQVCADDPHYYQACDKRLYGYRLTNTEILCENYICQYRNRNKYYIFYPAKLRDYGLICNGKEDCPNKSQDEIGCTALPSSEGV